MDLVTIIIPTYNRFKYLLNAIKSTKEQTYHNIEIIIVNDCSTQKEYYDFDFKKEFGENVSIYHLPKNSKEIYGFPSPGGHQRNYAMKFAKGKYIAFLDDDDYFLPTKIEKQINALKNSNCKICCTEGICDNGPYELNKEYQNIHYNGIHWNYLKNRYKKMLFLFQNSFKDEINIWNERFLKVHNCIICSSVMINRDILNKVGYFPIKNNADDYAYWKKIIKFSNIVYIREPLIYLDTGHGDGIQYSKKLM